MPSPFFLGGVLVLTDMFLTRKLIKHKFIKIKLYNNKCGGNFKQVTQWACIAHLYSLPIFLKGFPIYRPKQTMSSLGMAI